MKKPKVLILRAAGTNCDRETEFAFNLAGAECERAHINEFIHRNKSFSSYKILVIPGGFSYGDDVFAGKIFANELVYRLRDEITDFISRDKLILGICNGFQVLARAGILPGGKSLFYARASLTINDSRRFEDRWVYLRSEDALRLRPSTSSGLRSGQGGRRVCVWTMGLPGVIYLPVAHREGKFIVKNLPVLEEMKNSRQVVLRYCDRKGKAASGYPDNPNGSRDNVAGLCDVTGKILGLMPHPERYVVRQQHPRWTRGEKEGGHPDGLSIIENGVRYVS